MTVAFKSTRGDNSRTIGSMQDKLRIKRGTPPKDQGLWIFLTAKLLASPAFKSLSLNGLRFLFGLAQEHLAQGRVHNGKLIFTHDQARQAGCTNDLVADAVDELVFKGLVQVVRGRAAAGTPHASLYRLTMFGDWEGSAATNEWQGTDEERCERWPAVRKERAAERSRRAGRKKNRRSDKSESSRSEKSESDRARAGPAVGKAQ